MTRLSLVAFAVFVALPVPAFAMGGGGVGPGGGYGGFGGGMGFAPEDDYTAARRLIRHERYADAIPHLNAALQRKQHDPDIANYLGLAHRKVGESETGDQRAQEFDASLRFYQYALQFDPDHKGVHEYLGELYLDMNDLQSANQELAKLTALCPSGCDEKDTLAQAIAKAAPAAPASAQTPAPAAQNAPSTAQAAQSPAPQN